MKKFTLILTLFLFTFVISSCGLRERLLAPPDEIQVPKNAEVAECAKSEVSYKFVFIDPTLYLYFVDDVEQTIDVRDEIQEDIIFSGESVINYLSATFDIGACAFSDYN